MPTVAEKKKEQKPGELAVVKKMKDYSKEPAFRKKKENAKALLQKHGLPEAFTKKK
jgi:hypothetical protein